MEKSASPGYYKCVVVSRLLSQSSSGEPGFSRWTPFFRQRALGYWRLLSKVITIGGDCSVNQWGFLAQGEVLAHHVGYFKKMRDDSWFSAIF